MNDGDALDDLDACEARIDIRCWAVLRDPLENMLNGTAVFDSLTVARDGCGRMKSGTHEISVACAGTCDIAVHGTRNRIMFNEISVCGRFDREQSFGFINRDFKRTLGA